MMTEEDFDAAKKISMELERIKREDIVEAETRKKERIE